MSIAARAIGAPRERVDGPAKVSGTARYAFEQPVDQPLYLHAVQADVARGRITAIDTRAAEAIEGVVAVITHENAPRLADTSDRELAILQDGDVGFRGQIVGGAIAESPEVARHAANLVEVTYEQHDHDAELRPVHPELYAPEHVNAGFPTDSSQGDPEGALAAASVRIDQTYRTAMTHNNPMEPHASIARWEGDHLHLFESTQGVHSVRSTLAPVLGIEPEQLHVTSPHVGGGFGSKGTVHAHAVLAALAARLTDGRPVKLALTRQQMFALVGYRTPTIQHVQLGANADGTLTAITQDVVEQTSRIKEFAEQTAVPTRNMYAAPNRRTTHRVAPLDVAVPSWMRGPGETPGMFGPEVAMDELAVELGFDPVELRVANEPEVEPESGLPFSSRNLVACLRAGADRFGWDGRLLEPRAREEDGWLVGLGVACSTYPVHTMPGSAARIRMAASGRYVVEIGAADIGTGTWTTLGQIAADALEVDVEDVEMQIGDTALPYASVAGGSSGMTSWGSAVVEAARVFRERHGSDPEAGDEASAEMPENPDTERYAMHAFGAQFAEVRVRADSGEIRVPRLLGVFAAGRIINARTARSQFIGGMTMGLSMALHETSELDPRFGHVVNHDLAEYHVAANADVQDIQAHWIDEDDPHVNPMGSKGIGEIGTVGTAAAVANAAWNATGVRVRECPVTLDKLLT